MWIEMNINAWLYSSLPMTIFHVAGAKAGTFGAEIDDMVQNGLAQWAAPNIVVLDTPWYHC